MLAPYFGRKKNQIPSEAADFGIEDGIFKIST